MSQPNLLNQIKSKPILSDGGMGTQLMRAGLPAGACGVAWNVDNPDAVKGVHQRYRKSGCQCVTTNTFQGSREVLAQHGQAERTAELNLAAAQVARDAIASADGNQADQPGWVLGDCGPFGGFLEPLGTTTPEELLDIFTEQFNALHRGGADVALIETMSDPGEVALAIKAAKAVADWPVIATYAFQKSGDRFTTMMGVGVEDLIKQTIDAGADVVGANCGTELSLDDYRELAQQLVAAAGDTPVILQPNAGSPVMENGDLVYKATPDDMAALARDLADIGVRIIGGCCGTTPEHLQAMAAVVGKP